VVVRSGDVEGNQVTGTVRPQDGGPERAFVALFTDGGEVVELTVRV